MQRVETALAIDQSQNRRVHRGTEIVNGRYERQICAGRLADIAEIQFLIRIGFVGPSAHRPDFNPRSWFSLGHGRTLFNFAIHK